MRLSSASQRQLGVRTVTTNAIDGDAQQQRAPSTRTLGAISDFHNVPIGKILNVELPSSGHLYSPDLDVDLAVESIRHPETFPLVSRVGA